MDKSVKPKAAKSQTLAKVPAPEALTLLEWYDQHRRILPWRALPGQKPDPYRVWVSEIMLQQTTVAAVVPYFRKFMTRWPDLKALAKAPLEDILQEWAGLGYYRRARMLHACAVRLWQDHEGKFFKNEADLIKLPGFGVYTAAAVAAIAFNQRASVVDGNVERVMARLFAVRAALPAAKKTLRLKAASMLPAERYGDYAQALMDLGAMICTPRLPKCELCPWQECCKARALKLQNILPRRAVKKAKPQKRAVAFVAFNGLGEIFIRRRPTHGLLGGMMEVPSSIWEDVADYDQSLAMSEAPFKTRWRILAGSVRHSFTHFELEVSVAVGKVQTHSVKGEWIKPARLDKAALPSLMKKIINCALRES